MRAFQRRATLGFFISHIGLCRCDARNGYAKRTAENIVQANVMTELDRAGISPVFATDTVFDPLLFSPTLSDRYFHQPTNSALIQRNKGIYIDQFFLEILRDKFARIIA